MELAYCSIPSRIIDRVEEIMDFIQAKKQAPFTPFLAFPVERYEKGPVGRKKTLEFCVRAVTLCDTFHFFGISEGTLLELRQAILKAKPIFLHFREFDPEWRKSLAELKNGDFGSTSRALLEYLKTRMM